MFFQYCLAQGLFDYKDPSQAATVRSEDVARAEQDFSADASTSTEQLAAGGWPAGVSSSYGGGIGGSQGGSITGYNDSHTVRY
jgi:hypothetical protein